MEKFKAMMHLLPCKFSQEYLICSVMKSLLLITFTFVILSHQLDLKPHSEKIKKEEGSIFWREGIPNAKISNAHNLPLKTTKAHHRWKHMRLPNKSLRMEALLGNDEAKPFAKLNFTEIEIEPSDGEYGKSGTATFKEESSDVSEVPTSTANDLEPSSKIKGGTSDARKEEETIDQVDPKHPEKLDNESDIAPLNGKDSLPVNVIVTSDDAEMLKPPPQEKDDMPSFDEWKKQKLRDAEIEMNKSMEAQVEQSISSNKGFASKKGVNLASLTCGAKIVAANPEAMNAAALLSENRDQYMIQPCKASKWFVIELCEPAQIQTLEMANLELFSSLPKSFLASVSERYPSKDWQMLGTFHSRDERTMQNFAVKERSDAIFTKFVKIEMQKHYGNEHYCPLTIVRIYGVTVAEEDPEDREDSSRADANDVEAIDKPTNLFESATDTVMKIVNTVLTSKEKGKMINDGIKAMKCGSEILPEIPSKVALEDEQAVEGNGDNDKVLAGESDGASGSASNGAPGGASDGASGGASDGAPCDERIDMHSDDKRSGVSMTNASKISGGKTEDSLLIWQIHHPQQSLRRILRGCSYCAGIYHSGKYMHTPCGYAILLNGYPIMSCQKEKGLVNESRIKGDQSLDAVEGEADGANGLAPGSEKEEIVKLPAKNDNDPTENEHNEGQPVKGFPPTESDGKKEASANSNATNGIKSQTESPEAKIEKGGEVIYANVPVSEDLPENGQQNDENTDHILKLSYRSKETAIMKLKNKIKALEVNLTLSSHYLEELSQRYKRQMEAMYSSMDKTIQKLTNTSKEALTKDLAQQESIAALQLQIQQLNSTLGTVVTLESELYIQILKHHLLLILVESALLVILFCWCLTRWSNHAIGADHSVHASDANDRPEMQTQTPLKGKQSDSQFVEELKPSSPRRFGSESSLTIYQPESPLFFCKKQDSPPVDNHKKKKRRKNEKLAVEKALCQKLNVSSSDSGKCHKRSSSADISSKKRLFSCLSLNYTSKPEVIGLKEKLS